MGLANIVLEAHERILPGRIINHMKINRLTIMEQHGFWRKNSCATDLVGFLDDVAGELNGGEKVEVCFLDFQKALDFAIGLLNRK